ncbi:MAG: hypothetical protein GWM90_19975 [Gemmatimonadetes bacterium]|nr:hypothetical protein [Gemmatimonadota bacterium]NIQ56719.1 hypothetical protein [Gemmatimonadota bacterium]NIU76905.1 hypothetical protein [Gammaproteobacteria bacterium]NIX46280.1 hypothetical protein [Gemmatimonadota bacterium]NIY10601.1 hypothetical protein [Gemmatimonadota bacterium]
MTHRRTFAARFAAAGMLLAGALAGAPAAAQTVAPDAAQSTAVDSLVERGRLQEAAWLAREQGDSARADRVLARLEALLRSPPERVRPLGMDSQGVSYTYRLRHGQGVESIFKVDGSDIFCPECGADREVATYRVDRLLGFDLTPMTVPLRIVAADDTLYGSAMYFVNDTRPPAEVGAEKPDAIRLFDAIIGNSDRHRENWLVTAEGRAVAIDHNRAFEYQPTTRPKTCWETEIDSIAAPGDLGRPYERYRALPPDSLAAPVEAVDSALAARFLAMRDRVVERIESRIRQPGQTPSHDDCRFDP